MPRPGRPPKPPPKETDLLGDLLGALDKTDWRWCPHSPFDKQKEFLGLKQREALFAGGTGSSKSESLLMSALQYVHISGFTALLLRRSFKDLALEGAIMNRLGDWLKDSPAWWSAMDKKWTFPSGATITFGFCDHPGDLFRYDGAEFQFLGIDELTQWPIEWYQRLNSRLRRTKSLDVPLLTRCTAMPGGIGHEWVKRYFIDADTREPDVGVVTAIYKDNPHLDHASYERSLDILDPITRQQMKEGKWIQNSNGMVYRYSKAMNSITSLPESDDWSYLLGMDFGVNDACAFCVVGWRKSDPCVYVIECTGVKNLDPTGASIIAKGLSARYPFSRVIGDTGGLGKAFAQEMLLRHRIPVEAAEKHNKLGFQRLINGAFQRGEIKLLLPACAELAKELTCLPKQKDSDKEHEGFPNDLCDSLIYSWRATSSFQETARTPPLPPEERLRVHYEDMEARALAADEDDVRAEGAGEREALQALVFGQ